MTKILKWWCMVCERYQTIIRPTIRTIACSECQFKLEITGTRRMLEPSDITTTINTVRGKQYA